MTLGYIFPLPSPYTEAQQNQRAYEMWGSAWDTAAARGVVHHRALAEMAKLAGMPREPFRELSSAEWRGWRDQCQREKAK